MYIYIYTSTPRSSATSATRSISGPATPESWKGKLPNVNFPNIVKCQISKYCQMKSPNVDFP